jgi:hypothetical protein
MSATPGPWQAGSFDTGEDVTFVVDGPMDEHGIGLQIADNIHSADDARLIAAAPEMAEVLSALVEALNQEDGVEADYAGIDEAGERAADILDRCHPHD